MQFHLICDSTSLFTQDEAKQHNLRVVPLKVIFGDTEYTEGVDLTPAVFYEKFEHDTELPRTSQPTPAAFQEAFTSFGDDLPIVCTTIATQLSGTYSAAMQAKSELPDREIHVVDTGSVGPGHRKIVESLLTLQAADLSATQAIEAVQPQIDGLSFLVTVPTLEHLRRGGRIGGAQALMGSLLNIRPLIGLSHGEISPIDRIRTFSRVLDRMVQEVAAAHEKLGEIDVMIAQANSLEVAENLAERCTHYSQAKIPVQDIGPVIATHTGPGTIGVGYTPSLKVPVASSTSA